MVMASDGVSQWRLGWWLVSACSKRAAAQSAGAYYCSAAGAGADSTVPAV